MNILLIKEVKENLFEKVMRKKQKFKLVEN